ncbi:MAG: hypothetical protein EZS28_002981 [Streblomastix strix]|uniref:Uncharacterized protein n=1 Tax=Streblomastix strix TaxID=222440 RepID=A0A5J4X2S3_9EUKA|nr:MAG: hypothetical protein EZS28_002981 [Streblomastix strix]
MEENSGYDFTEYGDTNDSFQDEWNRLGERFDQKRRLGNESRSKISFSPPNSVSNTQTIPSIRSNGESLLIQGNAVWNAALSNLLRTSTSSGSNEDTERVRHKNSELRRRSAPPTLEQRMIARINLDNNEDFGILWMDNSPRKMRNRTKTTDQLPRMDLGLEKDVFKDDRLKKIKTTLLIKEVYQFDRETSPNQDIVPSFNNRQAEFSKSQNKRGFPLLKVNGLSKNKGSEEQRMEREYDSTQGNPSKAILVAQSDNEELSDDSRNENSRGSNRIRRISERLESDSRITNRGFFSPTWRREKGTKEEDQQQQGDDSNILRAISLRINLQRAADQGDPHQVRQFYRSIRFSKTKSRINSGSRSEENSQTISTTENTNSDSTYSRNVKQNNRCTMQVKYPGRQFSEERDIHSPMSSVGDNTNTGLVRNRGKQTRGQIRGNRRGRGRGRMVKRVFETMKRGDLLYPPTNSEDWKSPVRLEKVQTKVNHDSTLVARSNMVHALTNRQQQIPYSWIELSDSESGERNDEKEGHATIRKIRGIPHGQKVEQGRKLLTQFLNNANMTRETQQMIIKGLKFKTQMKYIQTMVLFDDCMKEMNYSIEDIMNKKIPFIHTEFMTWLA